MDFNEIRDVYWKYYIALENQFIDTSKYVEFDYVNNGKTYSIEYLKLFQAVCSEIDVVGKALATTLNPSFKATNRTGINEWWYYITEKNNSLYDKKCFLFGEKELQPWKDYIVIRNMNEKAKKYILDESTNPRAKTPTWWNDYNKVKHNRTGKFERFSTNYAKANLKNLFYAFAALYVLETEIMCFYFKKDKGKTIPTELNSKLFEEDLIFYTELIC